MKGNLIISIGILILMVSCKQKEAEKTEISTQQPKTELNAIIEKKNGETLIPEQYIENDSLLTQLVSDLYEISLNPNFQVEKETIRNRHTDPDVIVMDTIITYNFDKTKINFYKTSSEDEEWIYKAEIKNSNFKFLDSIRIGTKIETVEGQIKTELKTDLTKIGNLEQTSVFIFKFENGILKAIDYEGYVD